MVIFDRYYVEEMFSFHFHRYRRNAVLVLDLQDLHALRRGRQRRVEALNRSGDKTWKGSDHNDGGDPLDAAKRVAFDEYDLLHSDTNDDTNEHDPMLLRELASIHRCDLTLVCSPCELKLLRPHFQHCPWKLQLASFWVNPAEVQRTTAPAEQRNDFCFVGGFRHDPNRDAVTVLAQQIWPTIQDQWQLTNSNSESSQSLPPQLHIYGAFAERVLRFHDPNNNVFVQGQTLDLAGTLEQHRVMLAPLRFGADIKGKIVDAWCHGLPVVTTSIGAEGMLTAADSSLPPSSSSSQSLFAGRIADSVNSFADAALELYENKNDQWAKLSRREGPNALKDLYSATRHWPTVHQAMQDTVKNRSIRRNSDTIRSVLWQQSFRSTEFFSRWIEEKEKKSNNHRDDRDSNGGDDKNNG